MVVRWSAMRSSACRPGRSFSVSSAQAALSSSSTGAFFTITRNSKALALTD